LHSCPLPANPFLGHWHQVDTYISTAQKIPDWSLKMDKGQILKIARALADPTRFSILQLIAAKEEIAYGEVAGSFPIKQGTVSHHLKILIDTGLINMRKDGQYSFIRLSKDTLDAYPDALKAALNLNSLNNRSQADRRGRLTLW
jgi:ArsR family transcriptional regulator, arsenate/arsenite/antimonite-responsive transcriptional repressor